MAVTAYDRKPGSYDVDLAEVERGTPMGELMRRYWQPVGVAGDATDLPKMVRALGEDLVLFRGKNGKPGLVHPRCAHRGSSLFYGRVEDDGIRCCYHGWKFGVAFEGLSDLRIVESGSFVSPAQVEAAE